MATKQKHWQLFSLFFLKAPPSFLLFLSFSLCFVSYLSFHLSFRLFSVFLLSLCPIFLSFLCFSFHFFSLSFSLLSLSAPLSAHPDSSSSSLLHSFTPSLSLLSLWEVKLRNLSECCVFQRVRTVFSPAVLQPTAAPSQRNQHIITQSVSESLSQ